MLLAPVVALALAAMTVPTPPAEAVTGVDPQSGPGAEVSGAAGDGVTDGTFAAWRGSPVTLAGSWDDSKEAQTALWSIAPGGRYARWTGDLDLAIGAIYRPDGESWRQASMGIYDARWRSSLQKARAYWLGAGIPRGTLYLRFAHEFNGNWTPWRVYGWEAGAFRESWKRFRALQQQYFPEARLVFAPNDGTSGNLNLDWRVAFPGARYVDLMGVDSYNQYPYVNDPAGFDAKIHRYDSHGAPVGIERHRQYAREVGLPLAITEWSSNADMGDGDGYVRAFAGWLRTWAGHGPGQVAYDVLFNVGGYGDGQFQMYPRTRMPKAAAAYVANF